MTLTSIGCVASALRRPPQPSAALPRPSLVYDNAALLLPSYRYGAMLPPQSNAVEMILCVFLMVVSSVIWVYTMGQMCAIATSMDPDTANFHRIMDGLNMFMRERGIEKRLRVR